MLTTWTNFLYHFQANRTGHKRLGQAVAATSALAGRWVRERCRSRLHPCRRGFWSGYPGWRAAPAGRLPEGMPAFRILVVDDDASLRNWCCEIATGMGLWAAGCEQCAGGAAVLRQHPGRCFCST